MVSGTRMPAMFVGHGNPMLVLDGGRYAEAWRRMAREAPPPSAILCISAHWFAPFTAVSGHPAPPTLHDFGGFPPALYQVRYAAPGDPALAARVQSLLGPAQASIDEQRGLDHGAWAVLYHAFPEARVPVVELSIDFRQPPEFHRQLGARLAPLREEGVLLLGSGNVVHNLRTYAWNAEGAAPYPWASRFERRVRALIEAGEDRALVDYPMLGEDAALSIPTPDHYLPLLYVLGARQPDEAVDFPIDGIEGGSISMLCVRVGR